MVRVLVIITTAFVSYGGLATVMLNMYRQIDKGKFLIDFASTNEKLDDSLEQELKNNGSRYFGLGDRKRDLPGYIKRLSTVISNGNYDVVHVNSNSATALIELAIAQKNGVPKRIVHNHTSMCDHKILHKLCEPFFKNSYTDAIACSNKAGEWIFGQGNYRVLNNGIDVNRYRYSQENREEIRKKYKIDSSTVVLGHVGKIYKPKNHPFLIDVFSSYHRSNPDSVLLLVGDGTMRAEIESKVKELKLTDFVVFAGMQRQPEKYLSAMDCFVFPSIWEGLPLSVVEAQASGLHCLISDTIDESVVVTDEVKRLTIQQGTQVWVDALKTVQINDRAVRSAACVESICRAGFDAFTNAQELERIYMT